MPLRVREEVQEVLRERDGELSSEVLLRLGGATPTYGETVASVNPTSRPYPFIANLRSGGACH